MKESSRDLDSCGSLPMSFNPPPGVNRRAFLIRHAAIGAAAILTGTGVDDREARAQRAATEASASKTWRNAFAGPQYRQGRKGSGADRAGGILQSRARSIEFAHDRPHAYHLRFLSAVREAAV